MADEKDNKEKTDSKESKAADPKAEKSAAKAAAKKESKPPAKKEPAKKDAKDSGDEKPTKESKKAAKKAAPKADKKEAKGKEDKGKEDKDEKPAKPEAGKKRRRAKKADAKAAEKKPAPSRRRRSHDPDDLPVVRATARYVRIAPRKARLVADQVRGMHIEQARALLAFSPRDAARDIHKLIGDEMRITSITVDEGPPLRRYRPRALGRATPINKRTSHIAVALTPVEDD